MKKLVLFATKYGATKKCVEQLISLLEGEVDSFDLGTKPQIDLEQYHEVILVGPVYAGDMIRPIRDFVKRKEVELMQKTIGVCFCCMTEDKKHLFSYCLNSFGKKFSDHISVITEIGGVFQFEKMTSMDKFILKVATKNEAYQHGQKVKLDGRTNFNTLKEEKIQEFAIQMNELENMNEK